MNVLLIYPEFPDTFWSFKHALKFIRKRASSPPLGLLTVAAILPPEWTKRLIDVNVTKLTKKDLVWADYALISGMVVQRESARQIIARCEEAGVKVVAGGPLFTSEYEQFEEVVKDPKFQAEILKQEALLAAILQSEALRAEMLQSEALQAEMLRNKALHTEMLCYW